MSFLSALLRSTRTGPALGLLLLLSLAYNGYYLRLGFQADDLVFLGLVEQEPLPYSRWLGMWASDQVSVITNLWWFEGRSTGAFFRPLPSLLFEGSVRAFGKQAVPLHLLSIIVHGLVAGSVYLLTRRLTGRPGLSLLAGIFFLSFEDHSMGVAMITMVTDPLCVLFVNLALLAHARWLATRTRWLLLASMAALVPAFLSKESAALAPLGIVFMSLFLPVGRDEVSGRAASPEWRRRVSGTLRDWPSWAPALAMLAAYLVTYRILSFGGLDSGMYVDPLSHPLRYVGRLVGNLPVMWLATLSPVPPSLTWFSPALHIPFALAGVTAFGLWLAALRPLKRGGLVPWAMAFYLTALLPQMSAGASERALYLPAVGASILLAVLVDRIGFVARRVAPGRPPAPRSTRVGGWLALLAVLVPGALLSATLPFAYTPSFRRPATDAVGALPYLRQREPEHLVILNTPGSLHCFYLQPVIEHHLERPIDVRVLSSMNGVLSVERVDASGFLIHSDRPGWLTNPFAGMLRESGPPRVGKEYAKDLFTATIVELTADRTDVGTVRFRTNVPLADPSLLFLAWNGEAFLPLDLASLPVGEPRRLADTSDVWASMW